MSIVTAYVTRHCLSQGIRQMQGTVDEETGKFSTIVDGKDYEVDANDWFLKWENAASRARRLQKDKVRSMRRYADKVEELTFDKPE